MCLCCCCYCYCGCLVCCSIATDFCHTNSLSRITGANRWSHILCLLCQALKVQDKNGICVYSIYYNWWLTRGIGILVYVCVCVRVCIVWCYQRQQMANVQLSVNRHKCIYLRLFVLHFSFFFIFAARRSIISPFTLQRTHSMCICICILKRWAAVEYKCFSNAHFFISRDMDINLFQFFSSCLQTFLWFYCDRFVIFLLYSIIDDDNHRSNKLEN